jgi:hypothetical protein
VRKVFNYKEYDISWVEIVVLLFLTVVVFYGFTGWRRMAHIGFGMKTW